MKPNLQKIIKNRPKNCTTIEFKFIAPNGWDQIYILKIEKSNWYYGISNCINKYSTSRRNCLRYFKQVENEFKKRGEIHKQSSIVECSYKDVYRQRIMICKV